jgi:phosphoribosylformylglycinamidine cyclo-ligase
VLPDGLGARIERAAWEPPAVFRTLSGGGQVAVEEMDRVFNMGIGMIAIVEPSQVASVIASAQRDGVDAWRLGSVGPGTGVSYA